MDKKIKLNLTGVSETLLLNLYARAFYNDIYPDPKSVELVNKIDYDFSEIRKIKDASLLFTLARTIHFDEEIQDYLKHNPSAIIVNLGCGFDTAFYRNDNGKVNWRDVDFVNVLDLKRRLLPPPLRFRYLPGDIIKQWMVEYNDDKVDDHLFIAGGLFLYWEPGEVRNFIVTLAEDFPDCELIFDCTPTYMVEALNKTLIDKGIVTLKFKWGLDNVYDIEKWSHKINVVSQSPYFLNLINNKNIPDDLIDTAIKYTEFNKSTIVRLKFLP